MPTNPVEKPHKPYSVNNGIGSDIKKRETRNNKASQDFNESKPKFKEIFDEAKKKFEDREDEER